MVENKFATNIKDLSPSQQIALWVILHLKQKSFYTSEVANSEFFTNQGKKAIGGIMSALCRNGIIEKVSGGRDKLWKLNPSIEKEKEFYVQEITKVKTYWRSPNE